MLCQRECASRQSGWVPRTQHVPTHRGRGRETRALATASKWLFLSPTKFQIFWAPAKHVPGRLESRDPYNPYKGLSPSSTSLSHREAPGRARGHAAGPGRRAPSDPKPGPCLMTTCGANSRVHQRADPGPSFTYDGAPPGCQVQAELLSAATGRPAVPGAR